MTIPKTPVANRGPAEVTSIPTPLAFTPPIDWFQAIGAGNVTFKDETGAAQTVTSLEVGEIIQGPIKELTSMTCSKLRYGDGAPPVAYPVQTLTTTATPATGATIGSVQLAGDLGGAGGTAAAPRVSGVNSTTVAAGATTGQVLQATGANAAAFGSIDLTGVATVLAGLLANANNPDHQAAGAALTDASPTITIGQGRWRTLPAATLSANRSITLSTAGAVAGDQIDITRLDATANTLAIINGGAGAGTLVTMPASKVNFALAQFDGTNWALRRCGTQ